jgi:hypothetical protein
VYTVTTDERALPHELDREKLLKDPFPGAPHEGFADQAADAAGVQLDFATQRAASSGSARGRPSYAESTVRACSDSATSPLRSGHGWLVKAALPGVSPQARWDSESSCSDPSSAAHPVVPRHARTHFRVPPAMELPRIGCSQDAEGALHCEAAGFTPEYSRRTRGGEKTAEPEPGSRGDDERTLHNALRLLVPENVAHSRVTLLFRQELLERAYLLQVSPAPRVQAARAEWQSGAGSPCAATHAVPGGPPGGAGAASAPGTCRVGVRLVRGEGRDVSA